MGTCVFKTSEIRRCVEHALGSPKWQMGYFDGEMKPEPALLFVHDQGVYIMSNGIPRDPKDPADPKSGSYVVYAEGCNPDIGTFDEWYGCSRDLVGGDDFVEVIEVDSTWLAACDEFEELHVNVSASGFEVVLEKPVKRKKVHA